MKNLIISDIHANLAAFRAVLDAAGTWDRLVFLGDAVLAGPQPDEVLSLLRELDAVCIMGNHDREVLELDTEALAEKPERAWAQWHRRNILEPNLAFLAGFRDSCVVNSGPLAMRGVHGVLPRDLGGRLWPDSEPEHFASLARIEPVILFGHSHVQFKHEQGGRRYINPGSVGAPYLGQPLACYAVEEEGQFDLAATPYDTEETCRIMKERACEVVDSGFIEDWCQGWRRGTLPSRYFIRDYAPLQQRGFR